MHELSVALSLLEGVQEAAARDGIDRVIAVHIRVGALILKDYVTRGGSVEAGLKSYVGAAASIFFAYVGFDAVSTAAEETVNPQRNVPIGLIGSLLLGEDIRDDRRHTMKRRAHAADMEDRRDGEVAIVFADHRPGLGSGVREHV